MLTVGQLLIITGQNPGAPLSTNPLRAKFTQRPLSLGSLIKGYEKQRLVLFVELASAKVLHSPDIKSMADLTRLSQTADGQLTGSDVFALSSLLRAQGLSLRLLDKSLRNFAIVGLAPSFVNAPSTPINGGNLVRVLDKFSGGEAIGGSVIGVGAVAIGVGLSLGVGAATAPVWITVGAAILAFGVGFTVTTGILDMMNDPSGPLSSSQESTSFPNDSGSEGSDSEIEIPNAVAFGSPPDGFNTEGVLQQLADVVTDFSVEIALSGLPTGFDPDTGAGLPGIGDGEETGGGFGEGGVIDG